MKLKYIMTDQRYFIMFPITLNHDEVAAANRRLLPGEVRSAGFVNFRMNDDEILEAVPFGKSISLKMEAHPDDEGIINRAMNL